MECLGYLAFTRQNASLKSVSLGRGNDWDTQQGLLRQIKAIDFRGVNTTRRFAAPLRGF